MTGKDGILENEQGAILKRHWVCIALSFILILAGVLRVVKFGEAPPGFNQDEGVNAWNTYCLLKTGKDQVGVRWPIFYMRGIGGNWSPLYIYLSIPFQMIGGLSVTTARAPAIFFGILNIALIYYVGKRLFNEKVGLIAALLMAINPWHFQQCRWGHEACISALLGLTPVAVMLWSNIISTEGRQARPLVALLGGLLTGVSCYGYQPVRVFVPVFLFLAVVFNVPQIWQNLKRPKYAWAVIAFTIGFAIIFTPLAWQHIFHPEGINSHFLFQTGRFSTANLGESLKNSFARYIEHYNPKFLFGASDYLSPPNTGLFQWYMLPLFAAGLATLAVRFRKSMAVRFLLAMILAYPVGDCLAWGWRLSTFRSFVGLGGIIVLAALGTISVFEWLWKRWKRVTRYSATAFAMVIIISNIYYFRTYFVHASKNMGVYDQFHGDLVEACEWLKPRFDDFDAVIFTQFNMSNIVTVVTIGYDPNKWFNEPMEAITSGEWDHYIRNGKMYFFYSYFFADMQEFTMYALKDKEYQPGRVLLIVRPGMVNLADPKVKLMHKIIGPNGTERLWLCGI